MAPKEEDKPVTTQVKTKVVTNEKEELIPLQIVWRNVFLFIYLHAGAIYGIYLLIFRVKLLTIAWAYNMMIISFQGVTSGSHRLWAHRSYSATLPLRIYLAFANALAFQNSIFEWSRDHRVHHKYSETNADPHNAKRGFFFSHMGWLLSRKHPDVVEKGRTIDVSDLIADPVVRIQQKVYLPLVLLMCFLMPTYVPFALWGESPVNAFCVCALLRYCLFLHGTWLVNSAAHLWGDRPYDRSINPAESKLVSIMSLGEGFHNYHHTFPWDYAASEWGWQRNITAFFINSWAAIGLAYDLKRVPREIVNKRRMFKGDGSMPWYDEKSALEYYKSKGID